MNKLKVLKYSLAALGVGTLICVFSPAVRFVVFIALWSLWVNSPAENRRLTEDALFKRDIQLCRKVGSGYPMSDQNPRADCLRLLLKNTDVTESTCEVPFVKESLSRGCYFEVAAKQSNGAACERETSFDRDQCYENLARIRKEPSFCKKIERLSKDSCFEQVALLAGDKSLCRDIQNEAARGRCIGGLLSETSDLSLCAEFGEAGSSNCYVGFMRKGRVDLDFCRRHIPDSDQRECIAKAVKIEGDPKLCLRIDSSDDKTVCLSLMATSKNDMAICEIAKSDQDKDACYSSLDGIGSQREGAKFCKRFRSESLKIDCLKTNFAACASYLSEPKALENCIQDNSK